MIQEVHSAHRSSSCVHCGLPHLIPAARQAPQRARKARGGPQGEGRLCPDLPVGIQPRPGAALQRELEERHGGTGNILSTVTRERARHSANAAIQGAAVCRRVTWAWGGEIRGRYMLPVWAKQAHQASAEPTGCAVTVCLLPRRHIDTVEDTRAVSFFLHYFFFLHVLNVSTWP